MNLPKLGFRNIKTGIAVFLCLVLFNMIGRDDSLFACIASILCMRDTVSGSLQLGKDRIIGTILGGACSLSFLYAINLLPIIEYNDAFVIAVGVSFVIYMANLLKLKESCSICCMVYISIMFNYVGSGAFIYVTNRTLDTLIGVIIAILVNYYIKPPLNTDKEQCINN